MSSSSQSQSIERKRRPLIEARFVDSDTLSGGSPNQNSRGDVDRKATSYFGLYQPKESENDYLGERISPSSCERDEETFRKHINSFTHGGGDHATYFSPPSSSEEEEKTLNLPGAHLKPSPALRLVKINDTSDGEEKEEESSDSSYSSSSSSSMETTNELCILGQEEVAKLKQKLASNQIFMNMVIHDMRNPVVSAKLSLEQTLKDLATASQHLASMEEHRQKEQGPYLQAERLGQGRKATLPPSPWAEIGSGLAKALYRLQKMEEYYISKQEPPPLEMQSEGSSSEISTLPKFSSPKQIQPKSRPYSELRIPSFATAFVPGSSDGKFNVQSSGNSSPPREEAKAGDDDSLLADLKEVFAQHKLPLSNSDHADRLRELVTLIRLESEPGMHPQRTKDLEMLATPIPDELESYEINEVRRIQSLVQRCLQSLQTQGRPLSRTATDSQANSEEKVDPLLEAHSAIERCEAILKSQLTIDKLMEVLINDLMDHAKMENQAFSFSSDYFDLVASIEEAFTILEHNASQRKINLEASVLGKANLRYFRQLQGDSRRYLQVLLNFLSNSLKFTDQGGQVQVQLEVLSSQATAVAASEEGLPEPGPEVPNLQKGPKCYYLAFVIWIIDTGVGISQDGLSSLFLDFGKLQENVGRNKEGTGLGLSICKKIIEQMGGHVEVSSELGVGSKFKIMLSSKCQVKESLEISLAELESNESDHEREVFLSRLHAQKDVKVVASEEILMKRRSNPQTTNMSGALLGTSEMIAPSKALKLNLCPSSELDNKIWECCSQPKCLVANDEVMQLQIISLILKQQGFSVQTAVNGHEAFEKVRASLRCDLAEHFELVVLDLSMPICNGFQACSRIKSLFSESKLVEVESSHGSPEAKRASLSLNSMDQRPLLVALTSYVDAFIQKQTLEAGFDLTMQSPLTVNHIKNIIWPAVLARRQKIGRRVSKIKMFEEKVQLLKAKRRESSRNMKLLKLATNFRPNNASSASAKPRASRQSLCVFEQEGGGGAYLKLPKSPYLVPEESNLSPPLAHKIYQRSKKRSSSKALERIEGVSRLSGPSESCSAATDVDFLRLQLIQDK